MKTAKFDLWTAVKILEVLLVIACLVFKRVTDDEARSLSLYLQKLSREWSLLTNVTWDRIGNAVADATFGGYLIITIALLLGKIFEEIPTQRRIMEWVLLGVGAVLFIVLGSLSFASIDSVPQNLVDNAAILGTLAVVTGVLFLLDMGGPKAKPITQSPGAKKSFKTFEEIEGGLAEDERGRPRRSIIEQAVEISERTTHEGNEDRRKNKKDVKNNGIKNGGSRHGDRVEGLGKEPPILPGRSYIHLDPTSKGYKQMRDEDFEIPRRFGIYGKDVTDYGTDTDETASIPPKIELHTPVWSNIRKGRHSTSNYGVVSFRNCEKIQHPPDSDAREPNA